jgi:hypothetical protein
MTYQEVYLMFTDKDRAKAAAVNKGNKNGARKSRVLNDTLKRRLMQEDGKEANKVVMALLTKAKEGDVAAIREVMDRAEGKVVQESKISGDSEEPLMIKVVTGIDDND